MGDDRRRLVLGWSKRETLHASIALEASTWTRAAIMASG
jgi:hypothetical protein